MIDFKAKPFYLSDEQIAWVEETLKEMNLEQKCGQIFCPIGLTDNPYYLSHLIQDIGIGGIMYRPGLAKEVQSTHRTIQSMAKIPLLIAANTEAGGNGLAVEGTCFGSPLAVAATNDPENGYRMGYVACKEGASLGLNWSFAPVVDIDNEFHNPITNTRTFGSSPERVIAMASGYLRGAKENHVAVAIKHFPGDGVDERDQHLVTSVNSLSVERYMETYGKVYRTLIDQGAETVMVGHIAFPEWVKAYRPNSSRKERLMPATLSKEIVTGLLREKLGFNGLISTDSTAMIGFLSALPRRVAVPTAIAAGCDMFLFNKDLDEDWHYLLEGVRSGIVSEQRIDEAVARILATKAMLGLPEKQKTGTLVPGEEALQNIGAEPFQRWAKEVADRSVTLVRDEQKILPLSPKKQKRIYLNVIQKSASPEDAFALSWKKRLEKEGFEVTLRDRGTTIEPSDFSNPNLSAEKKKLMDELYRPVEKMKASYDLYLYVCNMQNASNNTTLRLNWNVVFGLGDDAPWFVEEVPTIMISTGDPYHLFDAPMIKTYINVYSSDPRFCDATMDKIMGRSSFQGVSPIDPLCGKDYL